MICAALQRQAPARRVAWAGARTHQSRTVTTDDARAGARVGAGTIEELMVPRRLTRLERQRLVEFREESREPTPQEKAYRRGKASEGYTKWAAKLERRKAAEAREKAQDTARGEQELGAEAAWFHFLRRHRAAAASGSQDEGWRAAADDALISRGLVHPVDANETDATPNEPFEIPRTRTGDPDWLPNGRCIGCTGGESTGCCAAGVRNPFE